MSTRRSNEHLKFVKARVSCNIMKNKGYLIFIPCYRISWQLLDEHLQHLLVSPGRVVE
ncbi:hypothetical protein HanRHA438_Chr15g0706901 [Helianthus annuus]|nr:hypothetical protein HanRHA438_Chr15g0706901 [Helianthus annuus]